MPTIHRARSDNGNTLAVSQFATGQLFGFKVCTPATSSTDAVCAVLNLDQARHLADVLDDAIATAEAP